VFKEGEQVRLRVNCRDIPRFKIDSFEVFKVSGDDVLSLALDRCSENVPIFLIICQSCCELLVVFYYSLGKGIEHLGSPVVRPFL